MPSLDRLAILLYTEPPISSTKVQKITENKEVGPIFNS